jgi:hypothetical protein
MSIVSQTVAQTLQGLAPTLLTAAMGAGGTPASAAVAVAIMQSVVQMQQAGQVSAEELVTLFATINSSIQDTHAKWIALPEVQARLASKTL